MSRPHHKDEAANVDAQAKEPAADAPGKVVIDGRGHNVWQWAKDVLESTSVLLKRLENKELSLEPTRKVPVLPEKGANPGEKGAAPKGAKSADSNAKAAKDAASKSAHFHPAIKPDQSKDRGGGFDPYNSR